MANESSLEVVGGRAITNALGLEVVVGLTGTKASGKDECGKHLAEKHGFVMYRTSDAIRKVALEEYGLANPTVLQMQEIGDAGRVAGGGGVWINQLMKIAEEAGKKRLIINGIRNPVESLAILDHEDAYGYNIAITAPTLLRWERFQKRQQAGDGYINNLEEFLVMDDRDRGVGQPDGGQQVDACIGLARAALISNPDDEILPFFYYSNEGTLEAYHEWIDSIAPSLVARS